MPDVLSFPTPAIPDAAARASALDITRSFIVEAPAGSGKTGLLIQRFLRLLADPSVTSPAQVQAITFTRKATAELRDRLWSQLDHARRDTPVTTPFDRETRAFALAVLERDDLLHWNLLDRPGALAIDTIDALCARIAAAVPILSGSGAALAPTDNAQPLYDEAARRTLLLLADPALAPSLRDLLLHRDADLADTTRLVANMLALRQHWADLVPLTPEALTDASLDTHVRPRLESALNRVLCTALDNLTHQLPHSLLDQLCELAAQMGHAAGYDSNPSPIAFCAGSPHPPQCIADHLDHWLALIDLLLNKSGDYRKPAGLQPRYLAFDISKPHKQQLAQLIDTIRHNDTLREALCAVRTLPPPRYTDSQWRLTRSLFRVLARALVELQLLFAERRQCDFTEVALAAATALRSPSALDDLSAAAGSNLQHLLVDEMQDTSTAQYELLQLLTRTWDGHSQTLFLVGDPKQSIYLFRQARVERFLQTTFARSLGDLPLTPLRLTANFRSQQPLVHHFNQLFQSTFPAEPDPARPEHVPFTAAHPTQPSTGIPSLLWHVTALPAQATTDDRIHHAREEAAAIRTLLLDWLARPLPPGRTQPWRIAILVRARAHLTHILPALRQPTPIPYRAVDLEPLAERPEILDLLALTRALLHPADRTAWLSLLRGPWCGLTFADLHTLAGSDSPLWANRTLIDCLQSRGVDLTPDGIARIQPLWLILQSALRDRATLPLALLVERTWRAFAAPAFLSQDALSNAARFFALLAELEAPHPGTLDPDHLTQRLASLCAAGVSTPGAVELLTIHKSKGLEWDLVIVPGLQHKGRGNTPGLFECLPLDDPGPDALHSILAPIHARGDDRDALGAWVGSVRSRRDAAERRRLLYVAATRARQQLHLFAAPSTCTTGELFADSSSLLHPILPAALPHLTSASPLPLQLAASAQLEVPIPTGVPHDHASTASVIVGLVSPPPTRLIERIPLAHLHAATTHITVPPAAQQSSTLFPRPEGSFLARTLGNVLHTLLEAQPSTGSPRLETIQTLLRSAGLSPALARRHAPALHRAIQTTLASPEGRWLLAPHPAAAAESALATPAGTLRFDRTFLAGPTPLAPGAGHLWIIDYKTATHGAQNLEDFLAAQQALYQPQLETYAAALAPTTPHPIRLGLFFPALGRLCWWPSTP